MDGADDGLLSEEIFAVKVLQGSNSVLKHEEI